MHARVTPQLICTTPTAPLAQSAHRPIPQPLGPRRCCCSCRPLPRGARVPRASPAALQERARCQEQPKHLQSNSRPQQWPQAAQVAVGGGARLLGPCMWTTALHTMSVQHLPPPPSKLRSACPCAQWVVRGAHRPSLHRALPNEANLEQARHLRAGGQEHQGISQVGHARLHHSACNGAAAQAAGLVHAFRARRQAGVGAAADACSSAHPLLEGAVCAVDGACVCVADGRGGSRSQASDAHPTRATRTPGWARRVRTHAALCACRDSTRHATYGCS